MALHEDLKALLISIMQAIQEGFAAVFGSMRYVRYVFIALAISLAIAATFFGYRYYTVSSEQAAQQALAEQVQDYYIALASDNASEWQRVVSLLDNGYKTYSKSSLAPYFLAFKAEAQLKQGMHAQALETYEQLTQVVSKSPLASLFKTKFALLQLDNADVAIQQKGLQLLTEIAQDKNNRFNDVALFYIGRYYWGINKIEEAQKVWQELIDNNRFEKSSPSPWAHEAQAKLKQLR